MKLHEESASPSLAYKLGDVAHVSGLAIRLARLSGAHERLPEWLMRVAVQRGARHYQRHFDAALPPDNPARAGALGYVNENSAASTRAANRIAATLDAADAPDAA